MNTGSYYNILGYIEIMEKKMEATIMYWGYIGIMEKKMQATIIYWGYIGKFRALNPELALFALASPWPQLTCSMLMIASGFWV